LRGAYWRAKKVASGSGRARVKLPTVSFTKTADKRRTKVAMHYHDTNPPKYYVVRLINVTVVGSRRDRS
jgi:hypothetical protein